MFEIVSKDFLEKDFKSWGTMFPYHCIYILENGKYAYIGETKDIDIRAKWHADNARKTKQKKYKFKKIHIITSTASQESAAKHFEQLLIRLMQADKKFIILNIKNERIPYYDDKNKFEGYFDDLWSGLAEIGLVETKDFSAVFNSSVYKYSPHTDLTEKQVKTLNYIVNSINSGETESHKEGFEARPILIKGDAGTGKTVVAVSLFNFLINSGKYKKEDIALVYPLKSMRNEIREVFKHTEGLDPKNVVAPADITKKRYKIVICDEAHKLRCNNKNLSPFYISYMKKKNNEMKIDENCDELDWFLLQSDCLVLFYDEKQITETSGITYESFKERLYIETRGVRPVVLSEQMRIKAGPEYISYIYDVLYQRAENKIKFKDYDLRFFDNFAEMTKLVEGKEKEEGLCRMCSGYAWEWKAKEDREKIDISIDEVDIKWNTPAKRWLSNEENKREMGSIYTLAGMDLNYAGVVIGPDIYYDVYDDKIKVNKKNYFDKNAKKGIEEEKLRPYILNLYAVLFTRGIMGTYIYVCDNNLREYFKKYF